ncbi:hypothetical protein M758_7G125200 [Ceratodon purpureus]|nr:hypothetical protein M758_7G125200 [Ceratodon purpureus]
MHACERPRIGMTMKDDDRGLQWKHSLPTSEELTPLSKSFLSPAFQSVFNIKPEPPKAAGDVSRESRASFLELRSQRSAVSSFDPFPLFKERKDTGSYGHPVEARGDAEAREGDTRGRAFSDFVGEGRGGARAEVRRESREAEEPEVGLGLGIGSGGGGGSERGGVAEKQGHGGQVASLFRVGSDPTGYNASEGRSEQSPGGLPFMMNGLGYGSFERRAESSSYSGRGDEKVGGSAKNARKLADSDFEDTDSAGGPVNSNEEPNARTLKRPRLVWTPQLHKRFVDAVGHLGIKNAVPKTIMQLMNVEGLTRENVASHLQKYRLYLKRLQGLPADGAAAAAAAGDQLFASTPLPPNLGLHYMGSQRDDVGPQSFPSGGVGMPFGGMGGRGPLGPAHFSAYEPIPYGGMNRAFMQRPMKDRTEESSESESQNHQQQSGSGNQASSPPKRLLSLFPTSSE